MTDSDMIAAYLATKGVTLVPEGARAYTEESLIDEWATVIDAAGRDFVPHSLDEPF